MNKIKTISISLIFIINLIIISNFDNNYTSIDDPEEILEFEDSNINFDNIQNTISRNRDIWIDTFNNENYIESKENVDITNGDAILKSQMTYTITSTSEFDAGTKNDVVTETDEYQIPSGQIQVESPCYERDSSLVLFLPLNEGTGSTANDESTYNNDGTISGATWVNGKYEKALDFDGSNDYVVIQDQNEFTISTTGTLSVQFWLKTGNDKTTRQEIISKGGLNGVNPREWATRIINGEFHATIISSSAGASIRGEKVSISANTWYHITVVYTGYTYTSDIEIFLNGVESSSVFLQSDLSYTNTISDIGIGKFYGSGSWHYFAGIVDEVKIYDRVLTPSEVQYQYNSGKRYLTQGTWESATLPWLANYRFLNTTITHSGLSATEKITEVRWKVAGVTKAIYSNDITAGSSTTITNSDLTSGNFNFIINNFNIEISLAGNGDATPVVEQIDGTSINTAGTLTSEAITLTTNNLWGTLTLNKTVPVNTTLKISVLDGGTGQPLSGFTEFDETSMDLSSIDPLNHPTLKLKADFTTNNLYTPQLHDWAVFWNSDPPVQTTDIPSDWSFPEDTNANDLIELTDYFEDIWTPGNKLKFKITHESDNTHIDATVDGKFLDFTTPTINWSGSETFEVRCTDEGGLFVTSNEFKVTVTEVNDPPAWTPIGYIYINEDSKLADVIELDLYITDCDDLIENISYSISSNNNPSNILAQVANRHVWVMPLIENYYGSAIIRISANDGFASANISFEIIIESVNDPPIVELLSPVNNSIITTSTTVKLTWSEGFDIDGTIISYDVYLDDVSPPRSLISKDQTVTSYTIHLEDDTYYWTV
ncbi:MAG: LamG domain-containing protein, partial [Thermoplasmata archaeon]|nr:LamG domain-containing protein [Thermoplasmata archaeon]